MNEIQEKIFEEMKAIAIGICPFYDDTYGYATRTINRIKDLDNTTDNFLYIFNMFDERTQVKLFRIASAELQAVIIDKVKNWNLYTFNRLFLPDEDDY
jgi:hypothetical protein